MKGCGRSSGQVGEGIRITYSRGKVLKFTGRTIENDLPQTRFDLRRERCLLGLLFVVHTVYPAYAQRLSSPAGNRRRSRLLNVGCNEGLGSTRDALHKAELDGLVAERGAHELGRR